MSDTTTMSKSERAYTWVGARITSREFGPGYRLVLGEIARELDMSVVPVREAIRRLEAEGLVTFERNVGARVALADPDEYVHAMQTLGVLEGAAMALAADHITPDDLDRAEHLNARMREMLAHFDPHQFTVLNEQFHTILFEECPNPHLRDLVERGWARLNNVRDSTFAFVPARATESVDEHDEILRLVREGAAPSEIEDAARQHRWRTMNAYLDNRASR
ncbi:GntR family transcriptional regulator [Microbacterium karelineae]|uniref:GntR family transcriptional regulator n=1 Tax=Microbacterium karelineae TaxID=2654283 RepID=UPI0012E9EBAB|nr:GntR family transcriptional regulator [Microbacterium karelineae]